MENVVSISVRNIVEFVLRSGNIDSRYMSMKRASEGVRIHQRLQRKRKTQAAFENMEYEKEATLKKTFTYKEFRFKIEGRADGIFKGQKNGVEYICIEEIKSTYAEVDEIENDTAHWHWAQLKCYGYIYASENKLENIVLRLTYCNIDTEELAEFESEFGIEALKGFFYGLVDAYYAFADLDFRRIAQRNESAAQLEFPFENYRKNQREFAVAVYKTIKKEKILFAQAPTGTGKTISTLFPAIKALGLGYCGKIFYLTAKTITRQVAAGALEALTKKNLRMRSIVLTAKEKICFSPGGGCNPIDCQYANGHFDRVNAAILDIVENELNITRQLIEEYSVKHCICPFEFSLDAALFCDCIVCDYNYVYDPKVHLKRFFEEKSNFCVLVDETHNLVERSREMFSAELSREDFSVVRKMFKERKSPLYKQLSKITKWFKESEADGYDKDALCRLLSELTLIADKWLVLNEGLELHAEMLNLYFKALDFLRIDELFDKRYMFFIDSGANTKIKLLCLDPSYLLSQVHKLVGATVLFSATLSPLTYFRDVLGGDSSCYSTAIPSPFDMENLALFVDNRISTRYNDRSMSLQLIASDLFTLINAKKGNYFAFFPSYEYLNMAYNFFCENYPEIPITCQTNAMSETEREAFLERFTQHNPDGLLAFVVMGGVFSEGIDLYGDKLIGAAIISVGLPLITAERNELSDYYKRELGCGFEYAYIYPGMIKVMQAAGRVIRSENDRGVVLLLDGRFLTHSYRSLFPQEWSHVRTIKSDEQLKTYLAEFWTEG